jgi:glycosyltransferase involved in cell wall biosynthesis
VVVHEAAVAGLPLICSDGVDAAPHILQDAFNGSTVPAGNVDALTRARTWMSGLDAQRLAQMSDGSRALGGRLSPTIWARNLHEQLEFRLRNNTRVPQDASR